MVVCTVSNKTLVSSQNEKICMIPNILYSEKFLNVNSIKKFLYKYILRKDIKKKNNHKSLKNLLKQAGFSDEATKILTEQNDEICYEIARDAWKTLVQLGKNEKSGEFATYRKLKQIINTVNPTATVTAKNIIKEVITKGTKYGKEIERDYYSELPNGLVEEMKKWRNNI